MNTSEGQPRRVGYELEFSGINLQQVVGVLESTLAAKRVEETPAECKLEVEGLGTFNVEIDWAFLKKLAAENEDKSYRNIIQDLSNAATLLVPMEVVCPPVAIDELDKLRPMVDALREAGAIGTDESFLAAYGVHVNTEIPALDADNVSRYLRAFALLQWWLLAAHDVDTSRRITPYIDLYGEDYLKAILSNPEPAMEQIIDTYLEYNNTRNRALDMLPMLASYDEERVRAVVDDPRIKPRPAFHYRLANCHIEQADWSLSRSWNFWTRVEHLAHRPDDIQTLAEQFLDSDRPVIGINRTAWVENIDTWLKDHELA